MIFPKLNKQGKPTISWSMINLFYQDSFEWWARYVIKKPFEANKWTDFGSKVGEALEHNNFDSFSNLEKVVLAKVERLDKFEEKVVLDLGDFEVVGFIDSASSDFSRIIDYKTGGKDKFHKYVEPDYLQMHIYSCAVRQMYGKAPESAEVHYITREGRDNLKVAYKSPVVIDMDITEELLDETEKVLRLAFEDMSNYYLQKNN